MTSEENRFKIGDGKKPYLLNDRKFCGCGKQLTRPLGSSETIAKSCSGCWMCQEHCICLKLVKSAEKVPNAHSEEQQDSVGLQTCRTETDSGKETIPFIAFGGDDEIKHSPNLEKEAYCNGCKGRHKVDTSDILSFVHCDKVNKDFLVGIKGKDITGRFKSEKSPENEHSGTSYCGDAQASQGGTGESQSESESDKSESRRILDEEIIPEPVEKVLREESDKKLVEKDIETWLNRDCPHGDPNCDLMPECIVELKAVVLGIIKKARAEKDKEISVLKKALRDRANELPELLGRERAELVKEIIDEIKTTHHLALEMCGSKIMNGEN